MKDRLEDEVWRAYGTLRYARLLTEKETLELLSWVRLGVNLRLVDGVGEDAFGEILLASRPNFLQNLAENENMSKNEIDRLRAEQVRKVLLQEGGN
jgi:protein arginine kinase